MIKIIKRRSKIVLENLNVLGCDENFSSKYFEGKKNTHLELTVIFTQRNSTQR